jgi:hypothetical protein
MKKPGIDGIPWPQACQSLAPRAGQGRTQVLSLLWPPWDHAAHSFFGHCHREVVASMTFLALFLSLAPRAPADDTLFEREIRPVLVDRCVKCHGPTKASGGLRLDSREAVLKGGDSGPAIMVGKPGESRLIQAVRRAKGVEAMPPDKALGAGAVAAFEKWVTDGASWPARAAPVWAASHWAFVPVRARTPPPGTHPIDGFLGAKPQAALDRRTLIRRVTYDLIGLPPTPEEIDAFLADTSPLAYEKLIDRLLASPQYGEKWGRYWLDVVRYADTAGETADFPVPDAWRYRNYVIAAFNRDLPYDQFIREQIAGDILAAKDPDDRYAERIVATGYLALARRFGYDVRKDHFLTLEDTIDTVGKSVLGLTLGCARCHDHKYDPISNRDYYALYGIFESTQYAMPGCEKAKAQEGLVPLRSPADRDRILAPIRGRLERAERELAAIVARRKGAPTPVELAHGGFANGGRQAFPADPLKAVTVKKGETVWLTVLPKQNHGADSTRVELEIRSKDRVWNLARDLVADPGRVQAPWVLLDAVGPRLFTEYVRNAESTPGLFAWRGAEPWPAVFVNTNDREVSWQTVKQPARSVNLHPGPKGGVAVLWVSPIDGTIAVTGRVEDLDASAGDGIDWVIARGPALDPDLETDRDARRTIVSVRREIAEYERALPTAYSVVEGQAHDAQIQKRGDPETRGDVVPRHFLTVLGGESLPPHAGSGRLALANWLTDARNPLTARVMVNRIWQGHFGTGIVATPNDFGTRGAPPTHPECLDWLAAEFVRSGWSVKHMHRLILSSNAYRTGVHRHRLTAEEIRDSLLAVSGELDPSPGGPHPFPDPATWGFTQHAPFKAVYETNRRSVYLMTQRIQRHPFLALFDGPDPNASTAIRQTTTVPTQALFFLNDPFVHRCADRLARRLTGLDLSEKLDRVCQLLYGRPADEADRRTAERFLSNGDWPAWLRVMLASNEFIYLD